MNVWNFQLPRTHHGLKVVALPADLTNVELSFQQLCTLESNVWLLSYYAYEWLFSACLRYIAICIGDLAFFSYEVLSSKAAFLWRCMQALLTGVLMLPCFLGWAFATASCIAISVHPLSTYLYPRSKPSGAQDLFYHVIQRTREQDK